MRFELDKERVRRVGLGLGLRLGERVTRVMLGSGLERGEVRAGQGEGEACGVRVGVKRGLRSGERVRRVGLGSGLERVEVRRKQRGALVHPFTYPICRPDFNPDSNLNPDPQP